MKFIRYGGLSPVAYKRKQLAVNGFNAEFHKAPANRGIYAFIYPYEDSFLWAWKLKKLSKIEDEKERNKYFDAQRAQLRRVFEYNGAIWCHFTEVIINGEIKGSWVLTDTKQLEVALKKIMHIDIKHLQKSDKDKVPPVNPYLRGLGGYIAVDHLEVFIDGKYLCHAK